MPDPVGEDAWLAFADEACRTASDIEQRVQVVELFKRAIAVEPHSINIWLAYCEWVWSLYKDCQNSDAGWPEDEQMLGREIFSLQTARDVWIQGVQATKYRLNDSHELWNRYLSIELENLSEPPKQEDIERIRELFINRLQIPHATWDDTSQMLSTFLTKYSEATWETTMVEVTKISKEAKQIFSIRETYESKLQRAIESNNSEDVKSQILDYLNWEQGQTLKLNKKKSMTTSLLLCIALFERALSLPPIAIDPAVWEDYIVFLLNVKFKDPNFQPPSILSVCQRATNHCPWSGALWARYILCAESAPLPFYSIEQIKHAATSTGDLDRNGMNDVVLFYIAWCGYLKRRTMVQGATDEDLDLADMGLPTAIEDVTHWGKRRIGKEWKGDPLFRIETILIQSLTERGDHEEARAQWRRLVPTHADSYDFWYQYYQWEMSIRPSKETPNYATAVLIQALRHKTLDWPEKIMEVYLNHCNNHEHVGAVIKALDTVHRISKGVAKRREREATPYNVKPAQLYVQKEDTTTSENPEQISEVSTRKREAEEDIRGDSKKVKVDETTSQEHHLKRDRENTTIIVTNLPAQVTQTKVKQYFKDYAHINSLALNPESDGHSSTALIELKSREDVQSALLKNNKYFGDRQITVMPGTGLTLYVTNYPPTADDKYFHELFKNCGQIISIRWPSVKYKTTRRFVYISFRTLKEAEAAIQLDGQPLGGIYKLSVAHSNPSNKKDREGATAEGREIHVTNLDTSLTEEDVKRVFSKYGTVLKVNILRKMSGKSKGAAFIVFEKRDEASAALELDKTKLKSGVLSVEISKERNFKPIATSVKDKILPAPGAENGSITSTQLNIENIDADNLDSKVPSVSDISDRTMTLLNIPDTVNDARIRLLASSYGKIIRLILRPDHQGALIEYDSAASSGKATLGLNNYEIAPGHRIRSGTLKDLFTDNSSKSRKEKIKTPQSKNLSASLMQPTAHIRRPNVPSKTGLSKQRGNDCPKLPSIALNSNETDVTKTSKIPGKWDGKKQMNNADFKALYLNGK